jgi:glutathione S-transferase
LSSPDILAFVAALVRRLAEENPDVMPEDDALGVPVLYGRHASPFVRRVAVTLRLYGIGYRHVPLMPFGADKAALAAFNPIARVPALQLGDGEMLIDSAVILDHLDHLAGPHSLTSAAGAARRRVLTLLAVALGANDKLVAGLYERHFRPREAWHKPWLDACDKQVRDGFRWLDAQFAGPWFTGAAMTQADITVAVFWLFGRGKRPRFFAGLGCAKLEALAERLQDTPEFQATLPEPETLANELG